MADPGKIVQNLPIDFFRSTLFSPMILLLLPLSQFLLVAPLILPLAVRLNFSLPLSPMGNLHLRALSPTLLLPST